MGCQWFLKHGVEYGVSMVLKHGAKYGVLMVLKHGAKYGVPTILKTWGVIWGVNIKKFLIIFLVFHQNDVYELQRPPYRVIIVMVW